MELFTAFTVDNIVDRSQAVAHNLAIWGEIMIMLLT